MKYLLVEGYGAQVLKHSERLVVRSWLTASESGTADTRAKREVPVLHLDHLLLGKGVSVTTDAIALCCERGIPITVQDWRGRPVGRFATPALHGTAIVRRAQLEAYDSEIGAALARAFVSGKLLNQADNLNYFAKNRRSRVPDEHRGLAAVAADLQRLATRAAALHGASAAAMRSRLMVIEAAAAKGYWSVLSGVYGHDYDFKGREQRGTRNPVNAALNFAYGVLQADIWNAAVLAGLEPYAGFLHVDRPGRYSLVLDLMEEFRPVIADRVVFALAGKGWRIKLDESGWLDRASKEKLLDALAKRLETSVTFEGKRCRLRSVIQMQARNVARHLLGKAHYAALRQRW